MSAPTLMAFTFAGQYAKMGVIALYPWMWYFLDRGLRERRLIHFAALAVAIAWGIYSPHPKMLYYALCGTGLFFLFRTYEWYLDGARLGSVRATHGLLCLCRCVGLGSGSRRNVSPVFVYGIRVEARCGRRGSGRTDAEQLAYAQSWSLHPEEVASLIVPEFGGFRLPKENGSTYWGRNPGKDNSNALACS